MHTDLLHAIVSKENLIWLVEVADDADDMFLVFVVRSDDVL